MTFKVLVLLKLESTTRPCFFKTAGPWGSQPTAKWMMISQDVFVADYIGGTHDYVYLIF